MERKYFGIVFKGKPSFDERDLTAKLFLSPRISAEHVKKIIPLLSEGRVTIESINKTSQEGHEELKNWLESGTEVHSIFQRKIKTWIELFDELMPDDYAYLEEHFGITKKELLGDASIQKKKEFSSPKELADFVKQYIKGQDEAIEDLSVSIYMHLDSKRKHYTSHIKMPSLLIGPTGSGKSEMLRIFGLACDCPVIHLNCPDLVAEGWKGRHLSEIFAQSLSDNCSIEDLKYAIIVMHELDKITHYGQKIVGNNGTDADADQQSNIMGLSDKGHNIYIETGFDSGTMSQKLTKLPVDNFLVLFDGAFDGIENIIRRRLHIGSTIGFSQSETKEETNSNLMSYLSEEDLIEWGYSPEFLGRIGKIITLRPLSEEVIYQIAVSAKGSILQEHIEYCRKNNINVTFSEGAIKYLAANVVKSGLGFRDMGRRLCEIMYRKYYELIGSDCINRDVEVSREYVEKIMNKKQVTE